MNKNSQPNKEFTLSYPEDREAIQQLLSQIPEKITLEDAEKRTRIGFLPKDEEEFLADMGKFLPANYETWISPWSVEERVYLDTEAAAASDLSSLQNILAIRETQIEQLQLELNQNKQEIRKLHQNIAELQEQAALSDTSDDDLADAEGRITVLLRKNRQLTDELAAQKSAQSSAQIEQEQVKKEIDNLTSEIAKLNVTIRQLQHQNEQELKHEQRINEENLTQIEELTHRIHVLTTQIDSLQRTHEEALEEQRAEHKATTSLLSQEFRRERDRFGRELSDARELLDESQNRFSDLEGRYNALVTTYEQTSLTLAELQQSQENLERQLLEANTARASSTSQLASLQSHLELLQSNEGNLNTRNDELQQQIATLESFATLSATELQTLRATAGASDAEVAQANVRMQTAEQRVQQLEQELRDLQTSSTYNQSAYASQMEAASREKQTLQTELETLRTSYAELQQQATALTTEKERLELNEGRLQMVANVSAIELDTERKQLEEARTRIASLESSLTTQQQEALEVQQRSERLSSQQQEDIARLQTDLENANQAKQSASNTVDSLRTENASLQHQVTELQSADSRREKEVRRLQTELSDLGKKLHTAREEKQRAIEALSTLQTSHADLQARAEALEGNETALTARIKELEEIDELRATELQQLRDSMAAEALAHGEQVTDFEQHIETLSSDLTESQALNEAIQDALDISNRDRLAALDEVRLATEERNELAEKNIGLREQLTEYARKNAELLARIAELESAALLAREEQGSPLAQEGVVVPEVLEDEDEQDEEAEEVLTDGDEDEQEEEAEEEAHQPAQIDSPTLVGGSLPTAAASTPTAVPVTTPEPAPNQPFWNMFLQNGGVMASYFTDELVEEGQRSSFNAEEIDLQSLNISVAGGTEPLYEFVPLKQGDLIHSTAAFPKDGAPGEKVVGKLVQDHTGKVYDRTTDKLSEGQKCLMALRQAEMILNNFTPKGDGDDAIIIEGDGAHAPQAKKLVAALLLLKDDPAHASKLKDVKIISKVPGCSTPEPVKSFMKGKETQEAANQRFIDSHLPTMLVEKEVTSLKSRLQTQVTTFTTAKGERDDRIKQMKQILHDAREHGDAQGVQEAREALDEATLQRGDILDSQGNKSP